MHANIEEIRTAARQEFDSAKTEQDAANAKIKYLGRKGLVAELFKVVPKLSPADRPEFGQQVNELRAELEMLADKDSPR